MVLVVQAEARSGRTPSRVLLPIKAQCRRPTATQRARCVQQLMEQPLHLTDIKEAVGIPVKARKGLLELLVTEA
jgi:hypothetical protein